MYLDFKYNLHENKTYIILHLRKLFTEVDPRFACPNGKPKRMTAQSYFPCQSPLMTKPNQYNLLSELQCLLK